MTTQTNNSNTITPCGTKEYMAPEMLEGNQLYSKKVDLWALGCLTYIVLFGGFPFYNDQDDRGRTIVSLKEKIHNGRYAFPVGNELGANGVLSYFKVQSLTCFVCFVCFFSERRCAGHYPTLPAG